MNQCALSTLALGCGIAIGSISANLFFNAKGKKSNPQIKVPEDKRVYKFKRYYTLLDHWLELKQNGHNLSEYINENSWRSIAIYGYGNIGKRLIQELEKTSVTIEYIIDNVTTKRTDIKLCSPDDNLEAVDVIIVSAVFDFDSIKEKLQPKVSCPVISLEDIVEFL